MKIYVWGDSHLDYAFGVGARRRLATHARHYGFSVQNQARFGARVVDWLPQFLATPLQRTIVVSSGWNEAAALHFGQLTAQQVNDSWYLLIKAAEAWGARLFWVPVQDQHGVARHFPETRLLRLLPETLGLPSRFTIPWAPRADQMAPDQVHYTQGAYDTLARLIIDRVRKTT